MKLEGSGILVTGAAGGIGSCTARHLAQAGARLLLTDLRAKPLEILAAELAASGATVASAAADISREAEREALARRAAEFGVSTLVNVAGINPFGMFIEQSAAQIEAAMAINTLAPMLLCRALLPQLARQDEAHIVNVGSVFGSLGYPGFAVYSASKFAVRGFTEALRRELADTSIQVHYVAPRATGTALSTDRVRAMNAELKVAMDTPETVAAAIADALRRSRREVYLGMPERWFARLNAIVPGLIDRVLRKQLPIIRRFASIRSGEVGKRNVESVNVEVLGVER